MLLGGFWHGAKVQYDIFRGVPARLKRFITKVLQSIFQDKKRGYPQQWILCVVSVLITSNFVAFVDFVHFDGAIILNRYISDV
jgi:hypothetical protein